MSQPVLTYYSQEQFEATSAYTVSSKVGMLKTLTAVWAVYVIITGPDGTVEVTTDAEGHAAHSLIWKNTLEKQSRH